MLTHEHSFKTRQIRDCKQLESRHFKNKIKYRNQFVHFLLNKNKKSYLIEARNHVQHKKVNVSAEVNACELFRHSTVESAWWHTLCNPSTVSISGAVQAWSHCIYYTPIQSLFNSEAEFKFRNLFSKVHFHRGTLPSAPSAPEPEMAITFSSPTDISSSPPYPTFFAQPYVYLLYFF